MIESILDPFLAFLYPRFCRVCGGSVEKNAYGPACGLCWEATRIYTGEETSCSKCGQPLSDRKLGFEARCPRCVEDYYDRAAAAADYGFAARAAVLALKEEPLLHARTAQLLTDRFNVSGFHCSTVIAPVPLSRKRLLERGFNQAEVLADRLSAHTGIPVARSVLVRESHFSMHRAGMDKKAREKTVSGAFRIVKPRLVREERVLLIDDVFTTGSTASACAMVLKGAGAAEVNVLTLARAPFYC